MMADVREMLGRLNPANIKFDVGRGGMPELTPQDIAAALAFIPAGLGREVFTRIWWPDGARLSPNELDRVISNVVHAEATRRQRRLHEARVELHMLEEEEHRRRVSTDRGRSQSERMRARVAELKALTWPYSPKVHVAIRESVLDELARPNLCPECHGRGAVMQDNLVVVCANCHGVRMLPVSDRSRAARIGKDVSTYRQSWKGLYEWLFEQVRDAEAEAADKMKRALWRDDMKGVA